MDVFGKDAALAALAKGMGFTGLRQSLIAQNVANVNTPGYKRHDLDIAAFESQMQAALGLGQEEGPGSPRDAAQAVGRIPVADEPQHSLFYRADLGGVDIDREMAELAKTTMLGSAFSQLLQKRISTYRMVIREGR